MPRKPSAQPNDVELEILRVLWDRGPCTIRDVHLALSDARDAGYSSTAKMVAVMCDKGLLKRSASQRPQMYEPAVPEEQTQKQIIGHLIHKVFGGSARKLVLRAVQSQAIPSDEAAEIRKLLKKLEGEKR
ncbi:MAG TPA: BlaI/MecI/CopY family transcriptional regulator [Humisphaera sp.]|jgi:predicted transcriptional regulator|nr:BlaI/MecI/CopY family transcriptional regulator [Humisphaera sp.]